MHLLLVKMSSLGDVVHVLPAVTDAAAHGFSFDWVVEEAFAAVPARHPAIRRVIPIGWRRWRGELWNSRSSLQQFRRDLRTTRYPLVLDAQGLVKSAAVVALARADSRVGFSWPSAREGAASLFYGRRIEIPRAQHAVDRLRGLFAAALGYSLDGLDESFGLEIPAFESSRDCLLLHGTTWASKHWPEPMWIELARRLCDSGWRVQLPWGNPVERERASRIASTVTGAEVLGAMTLDTLIVRMRQVGLAIGVDSGLSHLAAALGVPTLVLYGSTDAGLTGSRGMRVSNLQAQFPCAPCLRGRCGYQGPAQRWQDVPVAPACYSRLTPEQIWPSIDRLLTSTP